MKIAVASDDGKVIAEHTGRCRYFVIFDVTDGQVERRETLENSFTPHVRAGVKGMRQGQPQMLKDGQGPHGTGMGGDPHAALLGALEGVNILIARGMGPRLVNALASADIRAIFTGLDSVDEAAKQFAEGKLDELQDGTCDR